MLSETETGDPAGSYTSSVGAAGRTAGVGESTHPSRGHRAALQEADGMRKNVRELVGLEMRAQSPRCRHRGRVVKPKRRKSPSPVSTLDDRRLAMSGGEGAPPYL